MSRVDPEFGAFLRSRRARVDPVEVGLPGGGRRRVPGLRREELAALAAVSVDYVVRLEQGRVRPSDTVLDALARALRLNAAEREHLCTLARPPAVPLPPADAQAVRPAVARLVEALSPLPAYVLGSRLDILVWNPCASVLLGDLERERPGGRNMARLIFLDPDMAELVGPPERVGADVVGALRLAMTRAPHDSGLGELVEELSTASPAFRALWARRDVTEKSHGRKTFDHPAVGRIELDWERMPVAGSAGQALMTYSAPPGSPSATALTLLGTLAATAAAGRRA